MSDGTKSRYACNLGILRMRAVIIMQGHLPLSAKTKSALLESANNSYQCFLELGNVPGPRGLGRLMHGLSVSTRPTWFESMGRNASEMHGPCWLLWLPGHVDRNSMGRTHPRPLPCIALLSPTNCWATFFQIRATKFNRGSLPSLLAFPFIHRNLCSRVRSRPASEACPRTRQISSMDWDSYLTTGPDPRYYTLPPPAKVEKSTPDQELDHLHQQKFRQAVLNVLSTPIAEQTLAQIVDGLPLKDVALDLRAHRHRIDEPVFNHTELCPGVLGKSLTFRKNFEPLTLDIPSRV